MIALIAEGSTVMEPIIAGLIEGVVSGKIVGVGAIIVLAIVGVRLATMIQVSLATMVKTMAEGFKNLGRDLKDSRTEDRKEHKITRDRVEVLEKIVVREGESTRQVIEDKRLSKLTEVIEDHTATLDLTPASGMPAPRRKPSQPGAVPPGR